MGYWSGTPLTSPLLCHPLCNQGIAYFATERARLDKMLLSGSLASKKVEEFSKKSSVLGAFLPEEEAPADA